MKWLCSFVEWCGIEMIEVDISDSVVFVEVIGFKVDFVFVEMFLNLWFKIIDIVKVVDFIYVVGGVFVVDSIVVFLILICLIEFGVDIVMYFVIKVMNGYFDVFGGVLSVVKDSVIW